MLQARGEVLDFCIVGEPSDLQPVLSHKGKQAVELRIGGRAAHSSQPDLGLNAIYPAAEVLLFIRDLAARLAPVSLPGLVLAQLGGFLALVPEGDASELGALAAEVVTALDGFRAAPDAAEIARRRPERLSAAQRALLARWGYPYVLGEFRFHLTLTGDLPEEQAAATKAALAPVLAPLLPRPCEIVDICLFGEAADGRFHLLRRYPLSGERVQ
ncbi:MAG: hypothetical protein CVT86_07070 [Alphaproteobacteria bacterium HGW-Alphaproteobacteria-8]|nr:MAG: hypothetical protein CVT86_07070 [Alphaproteobacteria bacterium HGW-Alphaproteobacteria-8]